MVMPLWKSEKNVWRLCFAEGCLLYFTDNLAKVAGDDWNDAPCASNADIYYEPEHLRVMAFLDNGEIQHGAEAYSADDLNRGRAAWLYHKDAGGLPGGATMEMAAKWMETIGVPYAELTTTRKSN